MSLPDSLVEEVFAESQSAVGIAMHHAHLCRYEILHSIP